MICPAVLGLYLRNRRTFIILDDAQWYVTRKGKVLASPPFLAEHFLRLQVRFAILGRDPVDLLQLSQHRGYDLFKTGMCLSILAALPRTSIPYSMLLGKSFFSVSLSLKRRVQADIKHRRSNISRVFAYCSETNNKVAVFAAHEPVRDC
jgi:hypothetical protein